jgi:hypothetical protein
MNRVSFNISDNWNQHPELQREVEWRTASGVERCIMFETVVGSQHWTVRLNDFPDEPCFSVLIDGTEVIHFDDWPKFWGAMPPLPKKD